MMVRVSLPGWLFFGFVNAYQRFLLAQRETRFNFYSNFISSLLHIPIVIYLSSTLDFLYGVALAMAIQFILRFLFISLFIRFSKIWESVVSPLDPDNFRNLVP